MGALPLGINDITPFDEARANLTKLAEKARNGHAQLLTRNGKPYVAVIDARKLEQYHLIAREAAQLCQIMDVSQAFDRVNAGRPGLDPADAAARVRAHIAAYRKAAGEE
jgi:prevent-host-death family protein